MRPQSPPMNYKRFTFKKKVAKPDCISEIWFQEQVVNFCTRNLSNLFAFSNSRNKPYLYSIQFSLYLHIDKINFYLYIRCQLYWKTWSSSLFYGFWHRQNIIVKVLLKSSITKFRARVQILFSMFSCWSCLTLIGHFVKTFILNILCIFRDKYHRTEGLFEKKTTSKIHLINNVYRTRVQPRRIFVLNFFVYFGWRCHWNLWNISQICHCDWSKYHNTVLKYCFEIYRNCTHVYFKIIHYDFSVTLRGIMVIRGDFKAKCSKVWLFFPRCTRNGEVFSPRFF